MWEERSNTYITLPSNVTKNFFLDNTTSNYRTKLAMDMNFEGTWGVGLSELHYPRTWNVFQKSSYFILLFSRHDGLGRLKVSPPIPEEPNMRYFNKQASNGVNITLPYDVQVTNNEDGTETTTYYNAQGAALDYTPSFDLFEIQIPPGNYRSPEEVCQYINKYISQVQIYLTKDVSKYTSLLLGQISNFFTAEHNKKLKRICFTSDIPFLEFLIFNDEFGRMLGFANEDFASHPYIEKRMLFRLNTTNPIIFQVPSSIYVYTDIIEPERVGDSMASLLRVIPVQDAEKDETENSALVNHVFQRIYYKRVNRNSISSIQIQMADDKGEMIPFDNGVAIAVLNFRKVSI